ncbi:MAG: hypothetical protein QM728_03665 [Gordonia sp. (in: high G+C Gram-positive bacteria)]|uniref:hypothetical protein n=1 Tax=Gordonia sp. (in: high G+C Gram-positive bacteria) TaxID=84139 RepID=UPI0039E60097
MFDTSVTSNARHNAAFAWVLTALGIFAFAVVHLFSAVGELAAGDSDHHHTHDHAHTDDGHLDAYSVLTNPNSAMAWFIAFVYTLTIVPPLLALLFRSRAAGIVALIAGGFLVLGNVADGFTHAIDDKAAAPLLVALIAVGLPGFVALRETVRWIKEATTAVDSLDAG